MILSTINLLETHQGCLNVITLTVDEHSQLQLTSDITCAHTLEKSHIPAHMRAAEEISHHLVICAITSVHTVGKRPSNVSIQAVIACLHGQHT